MREKEFVGFLFNVCCVCRKTLGFTLTTNHKQVGATSHGLCPTCAAKEMKKIDEYFIHQWHFMPLSLIPVRTS